jgi:hypothetical protein
LAWYSDETGVKVSTTLQMSEGSVYNHCKRVVRAFRCLRGKFLHWPNEVERDKLKTHYYDKGFPGAIGAMDGTYIPLVDKLREDPMSYWCRKKFWAVRGLEHMVMGSSIMTAYLMQFNMQAVADFQGRFISYDFGWPGSVPDVSVWKESHLWLHCDNYLRQDEWLMADKGNFYIFCLDSLLKF